MVIMEDRRYQGGRGQGGDRPPPDFERSVNPILTRGTDYVHHITTRSPPPPGFFDLPTALNPDDDDSPNKNLRINLYLEKVQVRIQVWYFITKIVLTYCEKKMF